MNDVLIDDKMRSFAKDHTKDRMQTAYDRFKLTPQQRESMILLGTVGELVFSKFLDDNKIKHEHEFRVMQYADDGDFIINGKIIETKCSGYGDSFNHMNLLYSQDQFTSGCRKNFDYCVQIFINGYDKQTRILDLDKCTIGTIAGYIEFGDIAKHKNPHMRYFGDYYKVSLSALKPIYSLLGIIQSNKLNISDYI